MKITIAHLYPAEMNIYGDRGNIITLCKRLQWRGIKAEVIPVHPGQKFNFTKADIVFGGGGQDRGQVLIAQDLLKRRANLAQAAEAGVVMLTICGTYQLFGHNFTTLEGESLQGIGIFDAQTIGSQVRMIGNALVDSPYGELIGFENHSGQTTLAEKQPSLGKVLKGFGNNNHSKQEGAVSNNVFGTYLHGPLLPKNPQLADELIKRALTRRGQHTLQPLNDSLELEAASAAKSRPQ